MFRSMQLVLCVLLSAAPIAARAQATPDFSGIWRQDNDRCEPKRSGEVTLRIDQHGPNLKVETSISSKSANPRHAVQTYTTDGKISISTGADGDEFHTSVVWKNGTLVFSIEEHEDGRVLMSKETWLALEDGATLESIRERPSGEKQVLFFRKTTVNPSGSGSEDIKGR